MELNVHEAGTGAVRSTDGASERWDLMSGFAVDELCHNMDTSLYGMPVLDLINLAIQGAWEFLGHTNTRGRNRSWHLVRAWKHLAVAIQTLDMPEDGIEALIQTLTTHQVLDKSHHYPYYALRRLATTCDEGAKKYAEENWHNGFQIKSLLSRGIRHMVKWTNGDRSEDHLGHAMWGFMASVHTWQYRYDDMCKYLLGSDYTITPELEKYHAEHASRRRMAQLPVSQAERSQQQVGQTIFDKDVRPDVLHTGAVSPAPTDPMQVHESIFRSYIEAAESEAEMKGGGPVQAPFTRTYLPTSDGLISTIPADGNEIKDGGSATKFGSPYGGVTILPGVYLPKESQFLKGGLGHGLPRHDPEAD